MTTGAAAVAFATTPVAAAQFDTDDDLCGGGLRDGGVGGGDSGGGGSGDGNEATVLASCRHRRICVRCRLRCRYLCPYRLYMAIRRRHVGIVAFVFVVGRRLRRRYLWSGHVASIFVHIVCT